MKVHHTVNISESKHDFCAATYE